MIKGFVNFRTVLAKVYRDLNLTTEVPEATCLEWIAEVLEKIGTYYQYTEEKTCLELHEGKVKLPINFYKLVDIAYNNRPLIWSGNTMYNEYTCEGSKIQKCIGCEGHNFYINNNFIITDIKDSEKTTTNNNSLSIIYLGIPIDEEGFPLIPDDVYFMEACTKYITYMLDYREWRKGNVPDKVLQKSETDYLWYVGAAKGSANMPNAAMLENLKNVWVRLIPKNNEYNQFFRNNSSQERKKHH